MNSAESAPTEANELRDRLRKLSEASLRISENLDFEGILQLVIDSACELTGASFGGIVAVSSSGEFDDFVSSGMTSAQHAQLAGLDNGPAFFAHFCQLEQPLRVDDFVAYCASAGLPRFDAGIEVHAALMAPIRHDDSTTGWVYLAQDSPERRFSYDDQSTLVAFASQAALVIVNARRRRDSQRADTDLQTLVETSPVGVLLLDATSSTPVRANAEALRIVSGLHSVDEPPELLLESLTVRREDGREMSLEHLPLARALAHDEAVRAERIRLERSDGRSLEILVNATPVPARDGRLTSMIVTMEDLSSPLAPDRHRANILGQVIDELRSPLLAVKGSAATLLESLHSLDPAEAGELVRIIDAQASRIRDLIGRMFDNARNGSAARSVGAGQATVPAQSQMLLIEADPHTRRVLADSLAAAGFDVTAAGSLSEGREAAAACAPHVVLAGLAPEFSDGIAPAEALHLAPVIPVVLLADPDQESAVMQAIEAGAADYIFTPFSPTELAARVRAALRRHDRAAQPGEFAPPAGPDGKRPFTAGDLTIDYAATTVTLAGEHVDLTRIEYRLLCELAAGAGRIVSIEHLLRRVWLTDTPDTTRSVDAVRSAMKRLRRKLGAQSASRNYIVTVRGMGYRLVTG